MPFLRFGNDQHWIEQREDGSWDSFLNRKRCHLVEWPDLVNALRDELIEARQLISRMTLEGPFRIGYSPSPGYDQSRVFLSRTLIHDEPAKSMFPLQTPPKSDPTEFREWVIQVTAALNELASRLPTKSA